MGYSNKKEYSKCVCFDTETTGLDERGAEDVLELAMAEIVNGKVIRTFDEFGKTSKNPEEIFTDRDKPDGSGKMSITDLTHITKAMSDTGKTQKELVDAYIDYVYSTPDNEKVLVMGYNVRFDICIMCALIKRFYPDFDIAKKNIDYIDVMSFYKDLYPASKEFPNHKLETASKRFCTKNQNTHRAIDDVLTTYEVFLHILKADKTPLTKTGKKIRGYSCKPYINNFGYVGKYGQPYCPIYKIWFIEQNAGASHRIQQEWGKRITAYKKAQKEKEVNATCTEDF